MDELEGQPDQLISFDVVVDGDHHATVSIDGNPVSDGKPGPIARKLRALYIAEASKG